MVRVILGNEPLEERKIMIVNFVEFNKRFALLPLDATHHRGIGILGGQVELFLNLNYCFNLEKNETNKFVLEELVGSKVYTNSETLFYISFFFNLKIKIV